MTSGIFVLPASLLWAAVIWRWPRSRRSQADTALLVALLALAVTATLEIPGIESALHRLVPGEPNLPYLAKHLLVVVVGASAHEVLRGVTLNAALAANGTRARTLLAAVVVAVLVALFLAAPVEQPVLTSEFGIRYGSEPAVIALWAVFLAWLTVALVSTARLAWRYARQAPTGRLRTSLLLVGACSVTCLGYVVNKALFMAAPVAGLEDALLVTAFPMVSRILVWLSMLFFVAACTWLALPRTPGSSFVRAHRQLRHLQPLWRALCEATPSIALTAPRAAWIEWLDPRDVDVRRYRRVIEIRDGILALHPFAAERLLQRTTDALVEAGTPQPNGMAEAVALEAARQSKLDGDPPESSAPLMVAGADDLEGEVAVLEQLSLTYRQHGAEINKLARSLGARTPQPTGGLQ